MKSKSRTGWIVLACLGLLALGACKDEEQAMVGPRGTVNISIMPNLMDIQANVFSPICASHHSGAFPSGDLNLSSTANVLALVDTTDGHGHQIIISNDPDLSALIWKLEGVDNNGASVFGSRMPLVGPYLSQSTIDVIRLWITNGALNN